MRPPVIEAKRAHSNAIKLEPRQEATTSYGTCGWQENTSMRQRQGVRVSNLGEAAKAATVVGLESRGAKGRGGRGHARGGGKTKPASPVKVAKVASRSEEVERPQEEVASTLVEKVSTPVAQACAERKETQSPDLSSAFRKSPRSKEVRAYVCVYATSRGRSCHVLS